MIASSGDKIPLPSELKEISFWKTTMFVLYSLLMTILPTVVNAVTLSSGYEWWLKVTIVVPCIFMTQQGLHLLGWVGHEGFHGNLHKNRFASSIIGIICSSMVASFLVVGYALTHWNHHRNTNTKKDPDCFLYSPFDTFISRFLFSRISSSKKYREDTYNLAFRRKLVKGGQLPFSLSELCFLARFNLACSAMWLLIYIVICFYDPLIGIFCIVAPHILTLFFTGIRAYIEHAGTIEGIYKDTRSYISPLYSALFFYNNYHLEHHLYPSAPCYQLPKIHRYLKQKGIYKQYDADIDSSIVGPWRYATQRFPYPGGIS